IPALAPHERRKPMEWMRNGSASTSATTASARRRTPAVGRPRNSAVIEHAGTRCTIPGSRGNWGVMVRAAAIYCRISQDSEGRALGVKRQEADCRALAERKGWPVGEVYIDNDLGAYSGKPRPAYRAMLEALKAAAVDAVIVWHLD